MGRKSNAKWQRRLEAARNQIDLNNHKSHRRSTAVAVGSVCMSCALFAVPQGFYYVLPVLVVLEGLLLYGSWDCWSLSVTNGRRVGFVVVSTLLVAGMGYIRWPRLKVSPADISFRGIPQETYDFTVSNDTDSNAYVLRVPFQVSPGLDGKIEPRVAASEEDSSLPIEEYGYCFGKDGKEYLVVEIPSLIAHERRKFSLVYSAAGQATAKVARMTYTDEQPPHSPSMQVGGIPGNYRVCHMHGHIK